MLFVSTNLKWFDPTLVSIRFVLCFWYLLRLISWPLIKKGKTDNMTEVFVCVMNRCWVFSFKKWFFFRRGCACASVSLLSTRLRVWSSFLFPLSLVFIRVQFRFFFNRSSCVCVCAETVLPLYPFSNQNLAPSTRLCSKFDRRTLFHSVAVLSLTSCWGAAFQQATRRSFVHGQSVR